VMEKGESLQERATKSRVDVFTAAQVLFHTVIVGLNTFLHGWDSSIRSCCSFLCITGPIRVAAAI
jgi:hypothetical protein